VIVLSSQSTNELSLELDTPWTEDLWTQFMEEFWECKPTRLPMLNAGPLASLQELFKLVVSMKDSKRLPADRFWIARRNPPRDRVKDFLLASLDLMGPQTADVDFDGFFCRMAGRTGGVNIHRLQDHCPVFWARTAELTSRIASQNLSSPVRRWDFDTFFGTYRITPFGAHRDQASVFSFCLKGERTYCTWPPDYSWPRDDLYTPDPDRLRPHLDNAERFVVRAGQLFYWPSNRWHLVLTQGQPSVVVQASAYLGSGQREEH